MPMAPISGKASGERLVPEVLRAQRGHQGKNMPGIESSPALQRVYEDLLRGAGQGHLLETEEHPEFESDVRRLLAEARASEKRDGSRQGLLQGRTDDELLPLLRERLKGRGVLAFPLQLAYKEVLAAALEYDYSVPFPVLVGFFPTGSFNAQAVRVADGALLLINSGLMMFLHQTAQLMCKSFAVTIKDDDMKETQASVAQQLSHDELVRQLTDLVLTYLITGSSTTNSRSDAQSGVQGMLASRLTKGAECFVVGHELGHAIAGHLDSSRSVLRATGVAGVDLPVVPKSWEQEIEADLYGLRMLTPPSMSTIRNATELQMFTFRIAGAYLFFGLDALLAAIHQLLQGRARELRFDSDHPPSQFRAEALSYYLKGRGAERALEFPKFVQNWFSELEADVSSAAAARIAALA